MKTSLTLLVVLLLPALYYFTPVSNDNEKPAYYLQTRRLCYTDDGSNSILIRTNPQTHFDVPIIPPPADTVPGLSSYMDYATNGKAMHQLIVAGDSVFVVVSTVDSLGASDPNNSNSLSLKCNFSINHGLNWDIGYRILDGRKSRFCDASLVNIDMYSAPAMTGRLWNFPLSSTTRLPGGAYDVAFGAGSFTINYVNGTLGTDLFSQGRVDDKLACIVGTPQSTTGAVDTLYFSKWNPTTNSFTPLSMISQTWLVYTACSYTIAASPVDASTMAVAYCYVNETVAYGGNEYPVMRVRTTSNDGSNWSAPQMLIPNGIYNGDSCQCYWNEDIGYMPGTSNPYVVFTTVSNATASNVDMVRKGYKVCIWSPVLNGGNPVVIADWHNMLIMSSVSNFLRVRKIHVNSSVLSHPCISFKIDGSKIYVAYSVVQPDTSQAGFNFEDIYTQFSNDGGMTWSVPLNETNTPNQVEKYPSLPRTFRIWKPDLLFQWDLVPGCQVFNDGQPVNRVYWVYRKPSPLDPLTGNSGEIPNQFSLAQNYPNPFNPVTKIKFNLPTPLNPPEGGKFGREVSLIIYDMLGREVVTLVNNNLKPCTYEVDFNGSNYASGIYFYRLNVDTPHPDESGHPSQERIYSETKKMVLTK